MHTAHSPPLLAEGQHAAWLWVTGYGFFLQSSTLPFCKTGMGFCPEAEVGDNAQSTGPSFLNAHQAGLVFSLRACHGLQPEGNVRNGG